MNQIKFDEIVNRFEKSYDNEGNPLNMHYLLIQENDKVFKHSFNYRSEPSDIRSISKTVLSLVAGIVMDLSAKGKYPEFNQETYVYPIIEKVVNLKNFENIHMLNKVKIKHLLNHTVGFDQVLMMRNDIKEMEPHTYLDYIVNQPIEYDPGEYYLYSNAGFYLLSAVLQEFIEEDLLEFTDRHLFSKLEIVDYEWERYGNYLAGATRLKMFPEDLLKIGKTIMNKGCYKGLRFTSSHWIDYMLTASELTPNDDTPNAVFRRYAYANGLWLAKENIYFGHGTDGQTLVMIPDKNTIIITLADQKDRVELENIINKIIIAYL